MYSATGDGVRVASSGLALGPAGEVFSARVVCAVGAVARLACSRLGGGCLLRKFRSRGGSDLAARICRSRTESDMVGGWVGAYLRKLGNLMRHRDVNLLAFGERALSVSATPAYIRVHTIATRLPPQQVTSSRQRKAPTSLESLVSFSASHRLCVQSGYSHGKLSQSTAPAPKLTAAQSSPFSISTSSASSFVASRELV